MLADEVIGHEIADALVELGRALEIGEQEREAGDLEALIDVERIGAVDVAEGLVGEEPLGRQKRLAAPQHVMEHGVGDPDAGQNAAVSAVLEAQAQRPGLQGQRPGLRSGGAEDHRQRLALPRRLALDVDELRRVRHRVEHDDEFRRQLQRHQRLLARRQLERLQREFIELILESVGQVDAGTPEDLPVIFQQRQRVGSVSRDLARAWIDREGDLDHLVESRFIGGRTQRAIILVVIEGLEGRAGLQHSAAAGAQHIPRQVEQTEARGVQKRGDGLFVIEPMHGGEIEDVDPAQRAIAAVAHQPLYRIDGRPVGELANHVEQRPGFAHALSIAQNKSGGKVPDGIIASPPRWLGQAPGAPLRSTRRIPCSGQRLR
jgi:hypothetical protein